VPDFVTVSNGDKKLSAVNGNWNYSIYGPKGYVGFYFGNSQWSIPGLRQDMIDMSSILDSTINGFLDIKLKYGSVDISNVTFSISSTLGAQLSQVLIHS